MKINNIIILITTTLVIIGGIKSYSTTPKFTSPFRNTVEEAIEDCDTVYRHLETTLDTFVVISIEEYDNGYILEVASNTDTLVVYYNDAEGDERIDITKP